MFRRKEESAIDVIIRNGHPTLGYLPFEDNIFNKSFEIIDMCEAQSWENNIDNLSIRIKLRTFIKNGHGLIDFLYLLRDKRLEYADHVMHDRHYVYVLFNINKRMDEYGKNIDANAS